MSKNGIEQIVINFNPEWFQSAYYVYVLTIVHNTKGNYYYIGQTGDRKHVSARSPFYRLMGHFNTYNFSKGTDAQLVKGLFTKKLIIEAEGQSKRVCVEEAILNKTITIQAKYFKLSDFDSVEHVAKRNFTEQVELALINMFRQQDENLFNDPKKIGDKKAVVNKEASTMAGVIFNQLSI